jgi:hypothetical protein
VFYLSCISGFNWWMFLVLFYELEDGSGRQEPDEAISGGLLVWAVGVGSRVSVV